MSDILQLLCQGHGADSSFDTLTASEVDCSKAAISDEALRNACGGSELRVTASGRQAMVLYYRRVNKLEKLTSSPCALSSNC